VARRARPHLLAHRRHGRDREPTAHSARMHARTQPHARAAAADREPNRRGCSPRTRTFTMDGSLVLCVLGGRFAYDYYAYSYGHDYYHDYVLVLLVLLLLPLLFLLLLLSVLLVV
jgi:hypothetical protein